MQSSHYGIPFYIRCPRTIHDIFTPIYELGRRLFEKLYLFLAKKKFQSSSHHLLPLVSYNLESSPVALLIIIPCRSGFAQTDGHHLIMQFIIQFAKLEMQNDAAETAAEHIIIYANSYYFINRPLFVYLLLDCERVAGMRGTRASNQPLSEIQ